MVYEIDGKFYILASQKYREVSIEKKSDGSYDVKLNEKAEPIEKVPSIKAQSISVENAYSKRSFKSKNID